MNLQPIIRAIACAALIAACVAGAGWFPTQAGGGREAKPQSLHGAAALDRLKQDGQYDSLQAALSQARYNVSRADYTPLGRAAWHAPNPAAGYDAYITEAGVSIAVNETAYVSLHLRSFGYGQALRAVSPGEVSAQKQTINLMRGGGLREWFVNSPEGLEQGFTLAAPPGERQPGVPLRLALQVSDGWRAVAREDGGQVTLRSADKAVDYGKLVVRDSKGRNMPARLMVVEEQVVIEADDSEATYPLTIDPLFTFQQKLQAADGAANDNFGFAVALSGDTVVVGAWSDDIGTNKDQGSAYVFTRSGTAWTFQEKLTAPDGQARDLFGQAVAVSGDTVAVGAAESDIAGNSNQGSVYVFTRSGTVWTFQQKLTTDDGAARDFFGGTIALDGDTVAVGAAGDDINDNSDQGSAYVFTRSGTAWTFQQKLTAHDGAAFDSFGVAVALSGDTVAVGAWADKIGANSGQGSAYVFARSGATWTFQQQLTAHDGAAEEYFGFAVALSGDTVAVGTWGTDIGSNANQGSVYIFTRSGTVWTFQQKLTAYDGAAIDSFGFAVALSGDTVAVGARGDDFGTRFEQGSVYVFKRSGTIWTFQQKLEASDGQADDLFGHAVALRGDTLVVGASFDDTGTNANQGSVYIFVNACSITISPGSLPGGVSGKAYNQQLVASGGTSPYAFALSSGALPPGLMLSPNGLLSGTPTKKGTYQFAILATDSSSSSSCSRSRIYNLTIAPPVCSTITLEPPTLPSGAKGEFYSETLTASGGAGTYIFSRKGGVLPPGLSLSQEGVLSGTPTQTGNFTFTVLARDENGCVGLWGYTITITRPGI